MKKFLFLGMVLVLLCALVATPVFAASEKSEGAVKTPLYLKETGQDPVVVGWVIFNTDDEGYLHVTAHMDVDCLVGEDHELKVRVKGTQEEFIEVQTINVQGKGNANGSVLLDSNVVRVFEEDGQDIIYVGASIRNTHIPGTKINTCDEAIAVPLKYLAPAALPSVLFEEDFTDVPGPTIPVGWNETAAYPNWEVWGYAYAGGSLPEMRFTWSPSFTGISRLISPEIDATAYSNIELTFKHFVDNWNGGYYLKVQVSLDGGATWSDAWSIFTPFGDIGPETLTVDLSTYAGQAFQLAWVFDGYSFDIDYWYIDDIVVTGS